MEEVDGQLSAVWNLHAEPVGKIYKTEDIDV